MDISFRDWLIPKEEKGLKIWIIRGRKNVLYGKDLNEKIALGEHFEDIPTPATAPPWIAGIPRQTRGNTPFMTSTSNASRNVCHRCAQPGHLARDCLNQRVFFCWDCGPHIGPNGSKFTKACPNENTRKDHRGPNGKNNAPSNRCSIMSKLTSPTSIIQSKLVGKPFND
uniref:CCHC-type domain-containing protein n=1 Tax=Glossina palpalis gambiensis TaxID=67801 RepID=A0A1B0BEM5_9MUSC